eukprot:188475_1
MNYLRIVFLCISALLCSFTTTLSEEVLSNNDILYVNDFIFNFNLENQADWTEQYMITHAYNDFNNENQKRLLLTDEDYEDYYSSYEDEEDSDYSNDYELQDALNELDFSKYYDNNAYAYDYEYYDANTLTNALTGIARSCTKILPGIFKKLCVDWNDNEGFKFTFENDNINQHNLKWYYGNKDNTIAAKEIADNMYNTLDNKEIYFNNDYDWDNIDLVQNFLHSLLQNNNLYGNLMDTYHKYASNRGVRKCGFYTNMRMCVVFNPYKKTMQVKMALPHARFIRQQENKDIPANFDAMFMDNDELLYDDIDYDYDDDDIDDITEEDYDEEQDDNIDNAMQE